MEQPQKPGVTNPSVQVHHGQNIKRIRLLLGLPQKAVVASLGAGWTQKKLSRIENSPNVPRKTRAVLAGFFDIDIELIDQFDEAAGRMALIHIMKLRRQLKYLAKVEDKRLIEDIAELLSSASQAIHKERQNMQLVLSLLQQSKSDGWLESNAAPAREVKEARARLWRVA